MEFKHLGRTGLIVSRLCMGTMQFGWSIGESESLQILSATFAAGINFIDTADIYSKWVEGNPGGVAETYIGKWMKKEQVKRDKIIIATKVRGEMGGGLNDQGLNRKHIMQAVDASLHRLQTDYIDLYQAHSPDDQTPIDETLRAFDDLIQGGKVRYIGASNYRAWELMQALWTSDKYQMTRYDCLQPKYNLIQRGEFEAELRTVCRTYQLGVIPYSPLRGGFLTGKYRKGQPFPASKRAASAEKYMSEKNLAVIDNMEKIANAHQATIAQVALAWLLADPVITSPIISATSVDQLTENVGAVGLMLADEEMKKLKQLTEWEEPSA